MRQAVEKIDYDFGRLKISAKIAPNAAVRAKHFDEWTSEFLAEHERATVVHLGAGLDFTRLASRPGPGVTWYDVAALRWGIDDSRELERIDPRLQAKSRHTEREHATRRARGRDTPGN